MRNGLVRRWDVSDRNSICARVTLRGHLNPVFCDLFSRDGKNLATMSANIDFGCDRVWIVYPTKVFFFIKF
jgi:WD40 repeat protein